MFKKIFFSFFVFIFLAIQALSFAPSAFAQSPAPWYSQSYKDFVTKVYDQDNPTEIFGERYTAAQVRWIIYSLVAFTTMPDPMIESVMRCVLSVSDPATLFTSCGDQFQILIDAFPAGEEQTGSGDQKAWYAMVFTSRPISSVAYLQDISVRLKFVKEAKAQGFGFGAASPVLLLQRTVRDVTYFLLVLASIIMAFMIMFRTKIAPQVVITVQSALPRIFITLILITFSYAIAGFLIDLMYVVIGLVTTVVVSSDLTGHDWPTMFGILTSDRTTISLFFWYFAIFLVFFMVTSLTVGLIPFIGPFITVFMSLFLILLAVLILIASIRTIWLMLITYVRILFLVILGPIQILLGIFGGRGFGGWVKNLAAQLSVYPIVGVMFVMAFVFLRAAVDTLCGPVLCGNGAILDNLFPLDARSLPVGTSTWSPPLTAGEGGTISAALLWLGASLVTILLIPQVANMVKSLVEGRPFAAGTAIGAAVFPGPVRWAGGLARGAVERGAVGWGGEEIRYRLGRSLGRVNRESRPLQPTSPSDTPPEG